MTVTPQQKISKTLNSSKILLKYLMFTSGEITFFFWGNNVHFGGNKVGGPIGVFEKRKNATVLESQFELTREQFCNVTVLNFRQTDGGRAGAAVQRSNCEFKYEPQGRNRQIINLHKKWGFRRFQKERPKVCKTAFFAQKVCKTALLHTFRRSFWDRRKPHFLRRLIIWRFRPCGSY